MSASKVQPKILFQMTGSIACFKACQVLSKLVQKGYDIQVVASTSALQFIGNATIEGLTGKAVISDLFGSGNVMDHIHLVRWADLILVAPATANFINKAAHGVGDDLITTQFLAHDFKKPLLIAPAMNTMMYLHPVTQASIQILKQMNIQILETASGVLACGEVGWGRLLEPDLMVPEIEKYLQLPNPLPSRTPTARKAKKVLVTSGGTQEPIDQVRVLSNKSTGATGARIADGLSEFGFDVTYLHAQNAVRPQAPCQSESFVSFQDLEKSLQRLLSSGDYSAVIHAAAVSDFSISSIESAGRSLTPDLQGKISSDQEISLRMKKNPKLVNLLREMARNQELQVIAFKMTATDSQAEREKAVEKVFSQSHANLVVHNDMSEMNWHTGKHLFHVFDSKNKTREFKNKNELSLFLGEYLTQSLAGGSL